MTTAAGESLKADGLKRQQKTLDVVEFERYTSVCFCIICIDVFGLFFSFSSTKLAVTTGSPIDVSYVFTDYSHRVL